jgi:hypothetical protein
VSRGLEVIVSAGVVALLRCSNVIFFMSSLEFVNFSSVLAFVRLSKEMQGVQGQPEDEEVYVGNGETVVEVDFDYYSTGLTHEIEGPAVAAPPNSVLQRMEQNGSTDDYVKTFDPEFLGAGDEWLAKLRQVHFSGV